VVSHIVKKDDPRRVPLRLPHDQVANGIHSMSLLEQNLDVRQHIVHDQQVFQSTDKAQI
jgi:hypothetical protein